MLRAESFSVSFFRRKKLMRPPINERRKKKTGSANSIRLNIQANMAHNLTRQQSGVMIQLPLAVHKTYRKAPLSETGARYRERDARQLCEWRSCMGDLAGPSP